MKLSAFLLLVTIFNLFGSKTYSQNARLNLDMKDVPLQTVLNAIECQSEFFFQYSSRMIDVNQKVDINVADRKITRVLDELLVNTDIKYAVRDRQILLVNKEAEVALALQQNRITGSVTEKNGTPLPGVNVVVTGTTLGTMTDIAGKYSIEVFEGSKSLTFTFIGMVPQEISIGTLTQINVTMTESAFGLEEVVIIGYGEKKRVNLTGSVASVDSKVLESRPITNTVAAIQGIMPGLVVQRYSGQPGAEGFDLNIRGFSSTNGGNSPLVMIDGVAGNLDLLNPADIESISVLKDASASIYGARAANGVILVTTKKGKKGAAKISYSTNIAISKLAGMMETPNNYQMAIMDNEANIHNGAAPMYTPELLEKVRIGDPNPIPHPVYGSSGWMLFFTSTDWRKAVFENGFQQKHTINVSGGGENSNYYLSGTFADQKGVIKYGNDNNKRYNLRMNYDYDFSKRVRLESKLSFENQNRSDIGGVGAAGIMYETIFGMPNHPIYP